MIRSHKVASEQDGKGRLRKSSTWLRGRRLPVQQRDWFVTGSEQSSRTVGGVNQSAAEPFVRESWLGEIRRSYGEIASCRLEPEI
jgi:hypothetical protein